MTEKERAALAALKQELLRTGCRDHAAIVNAHGAKLQEAFGTVASVDSAVRQTLAELRGERPSFSKFAWLTAVLADRRVTGNQFRLLTALFIRADEDGYAWPTQETLAGMCGFSDQRKVRVALQGARELGHLSTGMIAALKDSVRERIGRTGRGTFYRLETAEIPAVEAGKEPDKLRRGKAAKRTVAVLIDRTTAVLSNRTAGSPPNRTGYASDSTGAAAPSSSPYPSSSTVEDVDTLDAAHELTKAWRRGHG